MSGEKTPNLYNSFKPTPNTFIVQNPYFKQNFPNLRKINKTRRSMNKVRSGMSNINPQYILKNIKSQITFPNNSENLVYIKTVNLQITEINKQIENIKTKYQTLSGDIIILHQYITGTLSGNKTFSINKINDIKLQYSDIIKLSKKILKNIDEIPTSNILEKYIEYYSSIIKTIILKIQETPNILLKCLQTSFLNIYKNNENNTPHYVIITENQTKYINIINNKEKIKKNYEDIIQKYNELLNRKNYNNIKFNNINNIESITKIFNNINSSYNIKDISNNIININKTIKENITKLNELIIKYEQLLNNKLNIEIFSNKAISLLQKIYEMKRDIYHFNILLYNFKNLKIIILEKITIKKSELRKKFYNDLFKYYLELNIETNINYKNKINNNKTSNQNKVKIYLDKISKIKTFIENLFEMYKTEFKNNISLNNLYNKLSKKLNNNKKNLINSQMNPLLEKLNIQLNKLKKMEDCVTTLKLNSIITKKSEILTQINEMNKTFKNEKKIQLNKLTNTFKTNISNMTKVINNMRIVTTTQPNRSSNVTQTLNSIPKNMEPNNNNMLKNFRKKFNTLKLKQINDTYVLGKKINNLLRLSGNIRSSKSIPVKNKILQNKYETLAKEVSTYSNILLKKYTNKP
jgi:hypothetical protein